MLGKPRGGPHGETHDVYHCGISVVLLQTNTRFENKQSKIANETGRMNIRSKRHT